MARELNKKVGKEFAEQCRRAANYILSAWTGELRCYHDDSRYAIKQFVLEARHSWGTAYCDWKSIGAEAKLKEALRKLGAANITGKVTYNRVCLTFNMSKREQKRREEVIA